MEAISKNDHIKNQTLKIPKNTTEPSSTNAVVVTDSTQNAKWAKEPEIFLVPDIEFLLLSQMSYSEQANWALVSSSHNNALQKFYWAALDTEKPDVHTALSEGKSAFNLFINHPECRKDKYVPFDEKGRDYLCSLCIGGPLTCKAIEKELLSIEIALANRKTILLDIQSKLELHQSSLNAAINEALSHNTVKPSSYHRALSHLVDGLITFDQLGTIAHCFKEEVICKYVDNGKLSFELLLTNPSVWDIKNRLGCTAQKYIDNNKLTIERAFSAKYEELRNLDNETIRNYIDSDQATMEQALNIDNSSLFYLEHNFCQKYIGSGKLTMEQAINILPKEWYDAHLDCENTLKYIDHDKLTAESAVKLSSSERRLLRSEQIQFYVFSDKLTTDEALNLTWSERDNLENETLYKCIQEGILTVETVKKLTYEQWLNLKHCINEKHIENGRVTVEVALSLTKKERNELDQQTQKNESKITKKRSNDDSKYIIT